MVQTPRVLPSCCSRSRGVCSLLVVVGGSGQRKRSAPCLVKPLAGHRCRRSQRPPSGASPDRDDARSALLDDGIDDALGDVDHGLADPREAAVQFATRDPLRAVLDAE